MHRSDAQRHRRHNPGDVKNDLHGEQEFGFLEQVESGDSQKGNNQADGAMNRVPPRDGQDRAADYQQRKEVEEGCIHSKPEAPSLTLGASSGTGLAGGPPPASAGPRSRHRGYNWLTRNFFFKQKTAYEIQV